MARVAAVAQVWSVAWELLHAAAMAERKGGRGVPVLAQQKQIQLGIMKLWVQSLALLSGLRIWCCHELWCKSQTWLGSHIAVAVV